MQRLPSSRLRRIIFRAPFASCLSQRSRASSWALATGHCATSGCHAPRQKTLSRHDLADRRSSVTSAISLPSNTEWFIGFCKHDSRVFLRVGVRGLGLPHGVPVACRPRSLLHLAPTSHDQVSQCVASFFRCAASGSHLLKIVIHRFVMKPHVFLGSLSTNVSQFQSCDSLVPVCSAVPQGLQTKHEHAMSIPGLGCTIVVYVQYIVSTRRNPQRTDHAKTQSLKEHRTTLERDLCAFTERRSMDKTLTDATGLDTTPSKDLA